MNRVLVVRITSFVVIGILGCLAACAGPAVTARVEVPPPTPMGGELPRNPPDVTDQAATQRWLEQEANRQRGVMAQEQRRSEMPAGTAGIAAPAQPTNDEATRAWLDRTVEERRAANPDEPPAPMFQTVERTVYVDRPVRVYDDCDSWRYQRSDYGYGYDDCDRYGSYRSRSYHSTFPINTVVGAGVGAIIGHQSHHRGRGAAIGAGIGLLLDLAH